jgi:transposase
VERYLGLDVHAKSCTLAVISPAGKKLKDLVIETNGRALIEAIRTIPGRKHLCMEEGTQSAWLYEILQPHVHELVVTTIPKSRGKKSDKADAYQRAEELLRGTIDRPVFKSPQTYTRLRELARSHRVTVRDRVRVQARLKAVYRSRGIPCGGPAPYRMRQRSEWLEKLPAPCRRRALHLYTHLDFLIEQERTIEAELLKELSKHPIATTLQTCPGLGPIRVARLLPIVITPHRFRTRQQFWSYCGLGIVMRSSSDWIQTPDKTWRRAWVQQTRGLSKQHNAELKALFKGAATTVTTQRTETPMRADYRRMLENGIKPNLAKLTLARKIAATVLRMWKDEEVYRTERISRSTTRALDS